MLRWSSRGDTRRGHRAAGEPRDRHRPSSRPAAACLSPGFVDLQVNGGGGVMLNDQPDVETIRTICRRMRRSARRRCWPTLITDTPEITAAAVAAGTRRRGRRCRASSACISKGRICRSRRKGAHDPALIRPMSDADAGGADRGARKSCRRC